MTEDYYDFRIDYDGNADLTDETDLRGLI